MAAQAVEPAVLDTTAVEAVVARTADAAAQAGIDTSHAADAAAQAGIDTSHAADAAAAVDLAGFVSMH